jgi:hypothetical protein
MEHLYQQKELKGFKVFHQTTTGIISNDTIHIITLRVFPFKAHTVHEQDQILKNMNLISAIYANIDQNLELKEKIHFWDRAAGQIRVYTKYPEFADNFYDNIETCLMLSKLSL